MTCSVNGCDREAALAGHCKAHYMQMQRAKAAGKRVKFTALRTPPGEAGGRIQLRPSLALAERITRAARSRGLTVQAWVLNVLEKETG